MKDITFESKTGLDVLLKHINLRGQTGIPRSVNFEKLLNSMQESIENEAAVFKKKHGCNPVTYRKSAGLYSFHFRDICNHVIAGSQNANCETASKDARADWDTLKHLANITESSVYVDTRNIKRMCFDWHSLWMWKQTFNEGIFKWSIKENGYRTSGFSTLYTPQVGASQKNIVFTSNKVLGNIFECDKTKHLYEFYIPQSENLMLLCKIADDSQFYKDVFAALPLFKNDVYSALISVIYGTQEIDSSLRKEVKHAWFKALGWYVPVPVNSQALPDKLCSDMESYIASTVSTFGQFYEIPQGWESVGATLFNREVRVKHSRKRYLNEIHLNIRATVGSSLDMVGFFFPDLEELGFDVLFFNGLDLMVFGTEQQAEHVSELGLRMQCAAGTIEFKPKLKKCLSWDLS